MNKYVPGTVTPEMLEEYRQKYETARKAREVALSRYEDAYRVYSWALTAEREFEAVYTWAKSGMVRVLEHGSGVSRNQTP